MHTFLFQRILRRLVLWHIHYAVYVEADLLAVRRPVLVAKAVQVSAVMLCIEGKVARANRLLLDLMSACRVLDL